MPTFKYLRKFSSVAGVSPAIIIVFGADYIHNGGSDLAQASIYGDRSRGITLSPVKCAMAASFRRGSAAWMKGDGGTVVTYDGVDENLNTLADWSF